MTDRQNEAALSPRPTMVCVESERISIPSLPANLRRWNASVFCTATLLLSLQAPAAETSADWPLHGRDYMDQRFAPWSLINRNNIRSLGLAWATRIDSRNGLNASPIIVRNRLYVSAPFSRVYALDMRSGKTLWSFDPQVRLDESVGESFGARVNRGVAYANGRIFVATADCRLMALDANTGKRLWSAKDCRAADGHYKNAAPRVGNGLVFTGASGSEFGGRGFVSAYKAATGKLAWRFYTVPRSEGRQESQTLTEAAKTWPGPRPVGSIEGGTVWDAMTYDAKLKLLYVGTGGAFPESYKERAPAGGDELFLESIVAIDVRTGRYAWHFQTTPHDNYDYNAASHMILADLNIGGRQRRVLMTAPKNGFFYVLDRTNGTFIGAAPFTRVTWTTGLDPVSGRPAWNPDAIPENLAPDHCVTVFPAGWGAHNWNPMSFNPETRLVYLPVANEGDHRCRLKSEPVQSSGDARGSGLVDASIESTFVVDDYAAAPGELVAWDPVAGTSKWRAPLVTAFNGGVMSTAGGVVFEGTGNGQFQARDTDTGNLLWKYQVGSAIHGAPASAVIDGEQYIVVLAGDSGMMNLWERRLSTTDDAEGPAYVLAFKLNGSATLPKSVLEPRPRPEPPAQIGTPADIAQGRLLFETLWCSGCHGRDLDNSGSTSVPDLRMLDSSKYALWDTIVRGGALKHAGMLAFPISEEESSAVKAYVISESRKVAETERTRRESLTPAK